MQQLSTGQQIVSDNPESTMQRYAAATGQQIVSDNPESTMQRYAAATGQQIVSDNPESTMQRYAAATGQQIVSDNPESTMQSSYLLDNRLFLTIQSLQDNILYMTVPYRQLLLGLFVGWLLNVPATG